MTQCRGEIQRHLCPSVYVALNCWGKISQNDWLKSGKSVCNLRAYHQAGGGCWKKKRIISFQFSLTDRAMALICCFVQLVICRMRYIILPIMLLILISLLELIFHSAFTETSQTPCVNAGRCWIIS